MSTRSCIIQKVTDNSYRSIYCHHDGYLEGVGATLKEFYTTSEKLTALLDLGDLSSLDSTIENTFAYGRDKGETDIEAQQNNQLTKVDFQSYNYLFVDGQWLYSRNNELEFKPF